MIIQKIPTIINEIPTLNSNKEQWGHLEGLKVLRHCSLNSLYYKPCK